MVRITFTGPEVHTFVWSGPASHLKLIVPEESSREAPMPLPEGPRSPNMRTYTPRRFDAASAEIDIDFVLHDHGPAGRWAARAQVGDRLVLIGPGSAYQVAADASLFVLIGDATALPAIETILAALPAGAEAHVLVEVADDGERRELETSAQLTVQWLPCGDDPAQAGVALEAALGELVDRLPLQDARIYIGCEASAMRRMRRLLVKERGLDRAAAVTRGYWKYGASNHPDGDYGDDAL